MHLCCFCWVGVHNVQSQILRASSGFVYSKWVIGGRFVFVYLYAHYAFANSESVKWVCLQQVGDCWDENATQRQQEFREEQCNAAIKSYIYQHNVCLDV